MAHMAYSGAIHDKKVVTKKVTNSGYKKRLFGFVTRAYLQSYKNRGVCNGFL